jgi:hypothetical protein
MDTNTTTDTLAAPTDAVATSPEWEAAAERMADDLNAKVDAELETVQAKIATKKGDLSAEKSQKITLHREARELRRQADVAADEPSKVRLQNEADQKELQASGNDHRIGVLNAELDSLRQQETHLLSHQS